VALRQFYQHFTSSFGADIFVLKNFKAKLKLERSFDKHFPLKKAQIKC